jgi:histidine triad (HIT) family protein
MAFQQKIIRFALGLARLPRLGRLVGWGFAHMSQFLPLHRLRQTPSLLAFYHPQPAYPVHILIVPRRPIAGLEALLPDDRQFYQDLFQTVQSLVQELDLRIPGYRLIVNGGKYQDFPQLHFHLVSGEALKPE